ncbi:MAG TPA: PfkB family carbohydrate kinase [Streptosporangiaceae bacterium]
MAAARVVVIGSINRDLIVRLPRLPAPGETVADGQLSRQQGGKGANQAVAASRAGAAVIIVGAVGAADGQDCLDALTAERVDVSHVLRADALTGTAVVLVDEQSGENLIAVVPGANARLSAGHVDSALRALELGPGDVVVLSFELPHPPLVLAAGHARRAGARLIVNPAPARPDYVDVLSGAFVTPNGAELASLAPGAGPRDTALALAARTGQPVLVTLGSDGALLADAGEVTRFPAHAVKARDTTGAGDTLTGVLAAGLAQGGDLPAAVRRAVAAAALAVTRDGARAGMPAAAEIDRLLAGNERKACAPE